MNIVPDDMEFNEQEIINNIYQNNITIFIDVFPILKKYKYFTKDATLPAP